jgi:hypothetical protein
MMSAQQRQPWNFKRRSTHFLSNLKARQLLEDLYFLTWRQRDCHLAADQSA